MAEYWKSTPRYWCKHCKVFIRDTPFERNQHEATAKHQANLKRFLREIHRNNEREQREKQKAKDEVQRLSSLVSGTAPAAARAADSARNNRPSAASSAESRPATLEERKKQMAQLAEMGVAIPEEFRRDMAMAGEWQTVSQRVIMPRDEEEEEKKEGVESTPLNIGVRKRKHEGEEEEAEEEPQNRPARKPWGYATRSYPGAEEDDDLDALLEKTKDIKRKGPVSEGVKPEPKSEETEGQPQNEGVPLALKSAPEPSIKKEESTEGNSSAVLPPDGDAQEGVPGVVFKKLKKPLKK